MPELPEVETIIRRLRDGTPDHPPVPGQRIRTVEVTWNRTIAEPDPLSFKQNLLDKTIIDVRRRGKFLHFPLSDGNLIAHLRMSGDMRMEPNISLDGDPLPPEKYDRVLLNFEVPWRLVFSNIRKFGRMWYAENVESVFGGLGPEPLSDGFSPLMLYKMLQSHHRQIKPLLMDQTFIAGLGNIYTDEILFRAKLHPLRQSSSLSMREAELLFEAMQRTLREGSENFGASLDWIYRGGGFQNHFNVYQQTSKPCPVCGVPIQRITVAQRGTHFCPVCQELPLSS